MMMSLGMFIFSLPTLAYQDFQRKADWRHARSARIGARDATQFVGPGDETITLGGSAMAELQDGAASLDELRAMAATGEAFALVDGTGRVHGAWVIVAIDERGRTFLADGTPLQIDFGIDLLRVDEPTVQVAQVRTSAATEDQGSLKGAEDQGSLKGEEGDGGTSPGSA